MSMKTMMLETVAKLVVGGDLFEFVSETVLAVSRSSISGAEKRAYVQNKTKAMFTKALTIFINLAIEVAVTVLVEKLENKK